MGERGENNGKVGRSEIGVGGGGTSENELEWDFCS